MRKPISLFLVALSVALVMVGCSSKKQADKPAAAVPATAKPVEVDRTGWPVIVAFGDSLTAGLGVPVEKNYPSQLQAKLDQAGYKYRVVNAGISGDTSAGGLNRIDGVLRNKPQIVILELGANDGLQGKDVAQMKQNLSAVIERLQKEQITVVLAGMQITPNLGPDYTQSFAQVFPDLAARYKIPMVPFFLDGVATKPELNQADGIHPTPDGYVYVVDNVWKTLEPLLKK